MAALNDKPISWLKKLGGLIAIILGFLLATVGYRDGSTEYLTLGIVLIAIGLLLIILMIIRRNHERQV